MDAFLDTDEVVTKEFSSKVKEFLGSELFARMQNAHHVYFKCAFLIKDDRHMVSNPYYQNFLYHPRLALKEHAKWANPRHESYVGEGSGVLWDIWGMVHYNLLNIKRLRQKLIDDNGSFGLTGGENADTISEEDLLKKFTGGSFTVKEVPKEITW